MSEIPYLGGRPWSSWTRDERYYCAVLYGRATANPVQFAEWLIRKARLDTAGSTCWDLGFEVAFYRDYLWHKSGATARQSGLSAKRTFDLCLFGDRDIVVIEAKVCEAYNRAQNDDFAQDVARLNSIPGLEDVRAQVVALASSRYFLNAAKHGDADTLSMFQGRVSWADVASFYDGDPLLAQADIMYKARPGDMLRGPA